MATSGSADSESFQPVLLYVTMAEFEQLCRLRSDILRSSRIKEEALQKRLMF